MNSVKNIEIRTKEISTPINPKGFIEVTGVRADGSEMDILVATSVITDTICDYIHEKYPEVEVLIF